MKGIVLDIVVISPFFILVPQQGKDLEINYGSDDAPETYILKWNGMGWEYEGDYAEFYIGDKTYPVNVRNAPSGDIVDALGDGDMIRVDRCENGWFHIKNNDYITGDGEEATFKYKGDKWVHRSVLRAFWTGTAYHMLDAQPDPNSDTVFKGGRGEGQPKEYITSILDMKNGYVKVKLANGKIGWTPSDNLCGNSLTTCP